VKGDPSRFAFHQRLTPVSLSRSLVFPAFEDGALMNLLARARAFVLVSGRALLLDVRGSSELTVPILMSAAGVATVGVIAPSMFQSGTTAANTMQSQANALQSGATGGGSASGGIGGLASSLSSSLGGGSSPWNISVGSNGVSASGGGISGSFGSNGVSVSGGGVSASTGSSGTSVSVSGGSGGSAGGGSSGSGGTSSLVGAGASQPSSGALPTVSGNTVTPQQAAAAQQALNKIASTGF
jgi:hypothetical protein